MSSPQSTGGAMEIDDPPTVDLHSAWIAKQDVIDGFLHRAHSAEPPKSTSLLVHVARMTLKADAGPIFYVLPYYQEASSLFFHLARDFTWPEDFGLLMGLWEDSVQDEESIPRNGLLLCTYASFPWHLMPAKCVVLADVELYCSYDGELFFSQLLHRLGRQDHAVTALCLDTRISIRTITAFRRWAPGCHMTLIEVPDTNPDIPTELIPHGEFADVVGKEMQQHIQEGGFVIAHVGIDMVPDPDVFVNTQAEMGKHGLFSDILQRGADGESLALGVNPGLGVVGVCPRLTLSVAQAQYTALHYDSSTSLLVPTTIDLAYDAIKQQEAWILKTRDPGSVRRLVQGPFDERSHPTSNPDPKGPAWNQDLLRLLLSLVVKYEGVPICDWPIRRVPDPRMAAEALRRLGMMGCIEKRGSSDGYHVTRRGRVTLVVFGKLEKAAPICTPTFEGSYLFALSLETKNPRLVHREALDQVRGELTKGVGQTYFDRGWLWMAVGFHLYMWDQLFFPPDLEAPMWEQHGMICSTLGAVLVHQAWEALAETFEHLKCEDLIAETSLTEPEVGDVEWALARAYQAQCVMIPLIQPVNAEIPWGVDLLTSRGAIFNHTENLDSGRWVEANRRFGSIVAIYQKVFLPDSRGGPLKIEFVTYIGREHCLRLGSERGQDFPGVSRPSILFNAEGDG
ncbi:uncharacterized protein PG998_000011 [Apiospora kogelbergensis]|uniref:uncharacterized protein n=1 Tax=Apiospora kogelbergensis TaxID=1337665 RepID=UPI00313158AE